MPLPYGTSASHWLGTPLMFEPIKRRLDFRRFSPSVPQNQAQQKNRRLTRKQSCESFASPSRTVMFHRTQRYFLTQTEAITLEIAAVFVRSVALGCRRPSSSL